MTADRTTLLDFPCEFPLKIIGVSSTHFLEEVTKIIQKHYSKTLASDIREKHSAHSNYTAITATIQAQDQPSLDALYEELTKLDGIKMVL